MLDDDDLLARYRTAKSPSPGATRAAFAQFQARLASGPPPMPLRDERGPTRARWIAAAVAIAAVLALAWSIDLGGVLQSQREQPGEAIEAPYIGEHASIDGHAIPTEREAAEARRAEGPPRQDTPIQSAPEPAPSAIADEVAPPPAAPQSRPRPAPKPHKAKVDPDTDAPDATIAAEMALLKAAQQAIASGNPSRALEKLDQHAGTFPRSQLGQERELARVRALCALGRQDDANAAAVAFRKHYVGSHLEKRLDNTCVGTAKP